MMSFKITKGVLGRLDCYGSRFYWQGNNYKEKYHLSKWNNLLIKNIYLLSKQIFKLLNEGGTW